MDHSSNVRVRFAPSPTGFMHIGNVRAALINYLFSQQKTDSSGKGTFVLRIEDTDKERNFDPQAQHIQSDLAWLGITFQEGPGVGGPYAPYFQSQRTDLYKKYLQIFKEKGLIYRCFLTPEELEERRQRQLDLGKPPLYDRTGLKLTPEEIEKNLQENKPFVWRFKLPEKPITIHDLARGPITFDMRNYSDFPITRQDGSFTFMFANFVDDLTMKISHVFRGEDHLSNTAGQAAMYQALGEKLPVFYHLPIICNRDGKKLSKRDFGFSLQDLKNGGYLPEAVANYMAILGESFAQEIMDTKELIASLDFDNLHAAGTIKYDQAKLNWVNHEWIKKLTPEELLTRVTPYITQTYPEFSNLTQEKQLQLIKAIQPELVTLVNAKKLLAWYFDPPQIHSELAEKAQLSYYSPFLQEVLNEVAQQEPIDPQAVFAFIKNYGKTRGEPFGALCKALRATLIGSLQGAGIKEIFTLLEENKILERFEKVLAKS